MHKIVWKINGLRNFSCIFLYQIFGKYFVYLSQLVSYNCFKGKMMEWPAFHWNFFNKKPVFYKKIEEFWDFIRKTLPSKEFVQIIELQLDSNLYLELFDDVEMESMVTQPVASVIMKFFFIRNSILIGNWAVIRNREFTNFNVFSILLNFQRYTGVYRWF